MCGSEPRVRCCIGRPPHWHMVEAGGSCNTGTIVGMRVKPAAAAQAQAPCELLPKGLFCRRIPEACRKTFLDAMGMELPPR